MISHAVSDLDTLGSKTASALHDHVTLAGDVTSVHL